MKKRQFYTINFAITQDRDAPSIPVTVLAANSQEAEKEAWQALVRNLRVVGVKEGIT